MRAVCDLRDWDESRTAAAGLGDPPRRLGGVRTDTNAATDRRIQQPLWACVASVLR
jgi:hypothetical protein